MSCHYTPVKTVKMEVLTMKCKMLTRMWSNWNFCVAGGNAEWSGHSENNLAFSYKFKYSHGLTSSVGRSWGS